MIRVGCVWLVGVWLFAANANAQGQDLSLLPPINETLPAPVGDGVSGEAIAPGTSVLGEGQLPPLPDELKVGPDWYDPGSWVSLRALSEWDGSFQFGLNGTEGNAQSLSYRTGFDLSRSTDRYDWKVDLNYARSTANGVDTQHNALSNSNFDWKLMRTRWSAFTRSQLEYDQFKAFDLRVGLNAGLAYKLVETESTNWKTRFGAGASREFGGPDDFWKPEAVFGFDLKYQLTKRQTLETTVDYFPTWEDFSDYRLVTNSGWQVVLDEASNLSLKIGVIDRYDSTPNGRRPNDIDYSILLLWKI